MFPQSLRTLALPAIPNLDVHQGSTCSSHAFAAATHSPGDDRQAMPDQADDSARIAGWEINRRPKIQELREVAKMGERG
jgi:hypothetical protein